MATRTTARVARWMKQMGSSSGLYRLNQWRSLARGARLARRDEGAYRPYSTEKQRRQTGCPARRTVLIQSIQATSLRPWDWPIPEPESSS